MANRRKGRPVDLPVYGEAQHNMGVYQAIGVLVVNWAADESWFQAMLAPFFGGDKWSAAIAWYSYNSTANRLELVLRLCRQHIDDAALLSEIEAAHTEFTGCSRVRNYFCHATYMYADDGKLASANNVSLSQTGRPLRLEERALGPQTLNQITDAARRLADLNEVLAKLPDRISRTLRAQRLKPPPSLP